MRTLTPEIAAASYRQVVDAEAGITADAQFDILGAGVVAKLRAAAGREIVTVRAPQTYIDMSYYERALAAR